MSKAVKDYLEALLFLALSLSLYLLYLVTIPLFSEPHGLLAMSDLSDLTQSGFVMGLLFGSSVVCVLLGVILMNWVSFLTPGMMGNFWATTYFFLWIDTFFYLSMESKSDKFIVAMAIGVGFIYLFFFLLHYFEANQMLKTKREEAWKRKLVHYWVWGWMGFYLGLSGFLAFHSPGNPGFRMPLAVGAMFICFINYLLILFLKKSEGKDYSGFSKRGRLFFTLWAFALAAMWAGQSWFF